MPKVTQLVVAVEDKPGVLAHLCGVLAQAGVNVEGVCAGPEATGKGKIRFVVSDPARAEAALKGAKVRCGREEALTLSLENRPGAIAAAAQKLAQAKVNIKRAYATTAGPGQATVIITVANVDKALRALGG